MEKTRVICPLCGDAVDKLIYRFHYDAESTVIGKIKTEFPEWTKEDGLCSRCLDFFHSEIVMEHRILPSIGPQFPIKSTDDFIVIPTGLRVDADPHFTGKGVTICFIDSGFNAHPDLVAARNRIKTMVDITVDNDENSQGSSDAQEIINASWHGTMTSVVCAGDGYLCNGLYKGIACDAELVLLKVMDKEGHIRTENICKALRWVLDYHHKYDIRIINMSLGDDGTDSYKQSEIDRLCEKLIEHEITIVAAAGNDENGAIKPPANSLHVISVGGADDENSLREIPNKVYHSTYGRTIDGLMKPELIAQAIWIAAPILPNSHEQKESELLHRLLQLSDEDLTKEIKNLRAENELDSSIEDFADGSFIRDNILRRMRTCKYISPHYMHVDGTSFAAPIISAVIAQLLEMDRSMTPAAIREVLFSTAKRINDVPAERQGFGLIQPRKAMLKILRGAVSRPRTSPFVNTQKRTIEFFIQNYNATQISLAGSFNRWTQDVLLMEPSKGGLWSIEIPMLPDGQYQYKFLVDEEKWIEDYGNPYREPDGFKGFNSILVVEESAELT